MTARITVLFLAPWVVEGGGDKAIIDWFRHISSQRFRKILVTTKESPNTWLNRVRPYADAVIDAPSLDPAPEAIRAVVRDVARRESPQIIHLMHSQVGFEMLEELKGLCPEAKTVAQFHCFDYTEQGVRIGFAAWVPPLHDWNIDAYSVVSRDMERALREMFCVPRQRISVIYLGVDREEFNSQLVEGELPERRPDRLNVLWVGRFCRQKNPSLLADIARICDERRLPIFFHVVGDGPERRSFSERAGEASNFRLYGFRRAMGPFYDNSDVLLMTSRWEGLPLVQYEAMAWGRPVVAPAVGAVGELLDDSTGRLLAPTDDPEPYVGALCSLLNASARGDMGRAAAARVAPFSTRRMASEHEALYLRLIGDRDRSMMLAVSNAA